MQEKSDTSRNFLSRTDILAVKLGLNIQDLPEKIGVSRASLFSYRSGLRPITSKAWAKLEAAEAAAGLTAAGGRCALIEGAPPGAMAMGNAQSTGKVKDPSCPEEEKAEGRLDRIEAAMERLEAVLERMAAAMEKTAEAAERNSLENAEASIRTRP